MNTWLVTYKRLVGGVTTARIAAPDIEEAIKRAPCDAHRIISVVSI